jgi:tetratricopeptide (TPR) repeat protein
LVTILFTDLVGSTALSRELGDHAADDVRRDHFEVLRQAAARTGGTEVKTIGDALMVSYSAAADAIAGAVAMQRGVARHNRHGHGPQVEMRVGISAGDATFEDGDWFGTPVIEAARLCSAAAGGQILVADVVRMLAGNRVECDLELLPPVDAKGLAGPLAAWQAVWEIDDDGAEAQILPLPPVFDPPEAVALVGRDAERVAVIDAWKAVERGDRRVVLIAGEPGIGKTRLVKDVCRDAHGHGATVLWGGCEEDLALPYQPFVEAIRWYASVAAVDDLRDDLGPLGGELVRLVPDLDRLLPDLAPPVVADADTERFRLFEAVVELLAAVSTRSPVVFVLDDVHWAAKPTLLLLRHLLRVATPLRILVVATYRDTDLDRTHPLAEMLADLRRAHGVERLTLAGLDEQGVADFLEQTAGHALDDTGREFARVIRAETEGNPFFVGEVLRHLAETGALVQRDGRWTSDLTIEEVGIPEGVREVIGRRLSHLEDGASAVLTIASVIGRDFDVGLLTAVATDGEDVVLDALETAEASGLVQPVPGRAASYRFSHALVRSTLYDELTTSRRLRVHRDIARRLATRPDADARLPELAHHFGEAAALGEVDRAVEYCRRAGAAAEAELAFEEAAAHYDRALGALELADEPRAATRADLLLASGRALGAIADPGARGVLLAAAAAARAAGDAVRLADVAIALEEHLSRTGLLIGLDAELIALHEEALATLADDPARRARLLAGLALLLLWSNDGVRRAALLDEALELARRTGDPEVLGPVLYRTSVGADFTDPAYIDRNTAAIAELTAMADTIHDPAILLHAHEERHWNAIIVGDRATAGRALAAIDALADQMRQPLFESRRLMFHAAHLLLCGRLDDAEQAIDRLEAFEAQHQLSRGQDAAGLRFRLYAERGYLAELEPVLAAMVELQPVVVTWRAGLIACYGNTDRLELAAPHIQAVAADDFAMVPRNPYWVVTVAALARHAPGAGLLDVADRALTLMLPFSHTVPITGVSYEQPVGMSLGVAAAALGRWDDAERLFAQALDVATRLDAPTFVAITQAEWALALLRQATPAAAARARPLATSALATADRLGLGRVGELARRALRPTGG